jgi:hypothetical protein
MPSQTCVVHPETAATFRCDGCGRLLCSACVEQGHRLLFCRRWAIRRRLVAYSERSAVSGSTRVARRAGSQLASSATAVRTQGTPM